MNKTELEKKLAHAKAGVEVHSHQRDSYLCDIRALETQLAELNKAKTGRVKIGDDLSGVEKVWWINWKGKIVELMNDEWCSEIIAKGDVFYDQPTAELFALREATEFKIWCEFGTDVAIVYNEWQKVYMVHRGVKYDHDCDCHFEIESFLDTLSPKELNAIRSE